MLSLPKINEVVSRVASAALKPAARVLRVESEPTADSHGQDALHITIVLEQGGADKIGGDQALDTIVEIVKSLRRAKEDRFSLVDFVGEEELEPSGDTES